MAQPFISVVLTTHDPHRGRLERTLVGLLSQSLPCTDWELVVVDNASTVALTAVELELNRFCNWMLVREPRLGLTYGRLRGISESRSPVLVFVDDDNVLAPSYLHECLNIFDRNPSLGVGGGKCIPEWQSGCPEEWVAEFYEFLAIRDIGEHELLSISDGSASYPNCGPIGAGMIVKRDAIVSWAKEASVHYPPLGRVGTELLSGEDNDIVLRVYRNGWQVGYFPQLQLAHLIPAERVHREYLGRLLHGVSKSGVHWRLRHGMGTFAPAARWTLPLRKLRAYWRFRAWAGPAEYVRWRGACGQFDARAELTVSRTAK
jgi:glycosyltransferase involved in cell wall biosynthesis